MIDWTQTDTQILAELLAEVSTPTGRLITFGDIDAALGEDAYRVVVSVFEAAQQVNPSLRPAFLALSTTGLTLDSPSRLAMLSQLATSGHGQDGSEPWPSDWVDAIKAMAITVQPRWQKNGLPEQPTIESVASSREQYLRDQEAIRRLVEINATRQYFDDVATDLRRAIESGTLPRDSVADAFTTAWAQICQR